MSHRVTVMLSDDNVKALRIEQSKQLAKSNKSISFSNVVNQAIEKARGLKK